MSDDCGYFVWEHEQTSNEVEILKKDNEEMWLMLKKISEEKNIMEGKMEKSKNKKKKKMEEQILEAAKAERMGMRACLDLDSFCLCVMFNCW